MSARAPAWPPLASADLMPYIDAFKARQKAIRYKVSAWTAHYHVDDGEKLELEFMSHGAQVLITLWGDGLLFVRTCGSDSKKGGWTFNESLYGVWREMKPSDLVATVEETLYVHRGLKERSLDAEIYNLWSPVRPKAHAEECVAHLEEVLRPEGPSNNPLHLTGPAHTPKG